MAKFKYRVQERQLKNGSVVFMPQFRVLSFPEWLYGWHDMRVNPEPTLDLALGLIKGLKKSDAEREGKEVKKVLRNLKA